MNRERLFDIVLGLLGATTVAMAALVAKRLLVAPPDPNTPTTIRDWRPYAASGFRVGPNPAPVTVVEFADYQCPFCRRLESSLAKVAAEHPDSVAIVRRQFPLTSLHPAAFDAAAAALCAAKAGRFVPMHELLYRVQDSLELIPWTALGTRAGIQDTLALVHCMNADSTASAIRADVAAATRLGATGTPTLLVNEWRIVGMPSEPALDSLVVRELRKAGAL